MFFVFESYPDRTASYAGVMCVLMDLLKSRIWKMRQILLCTWLLLIMWALQIFQIFFSVILFLFFVSYTLQFLQIYLLPWIFVLVLVENSEFYLFSPFLQIYLPPWIFVLVLMENSEFDSFSPSQESFNILDHILNLINNW